MIKIEHTIYTFTSSVKVSLETENTEKAEEFVQQIKSKAPVDIVRWLADRALETGVTVVIDGRKDHA